MKKIELLSPAGDFESLEYAVKSGADAVYIGGKNFGARMFAKNFSVLEIEKAVKLCHLYGVKIYITVNTIVFDDEIEEVINYVRELHRIGVDALIVQDIGLMYILKNKFPNLEIHSSTQSHNVDNYSLLAMKDLGSKRCVLARELSLDEINKLDNILDLEVFIHGALCISYSGECLFSSLNGNRSGNRGECTGSCRLPYNLYQNDKLIAKNKYLLSTRSLCTVTKLKDILNTNITSLKIEGRMKSKEYVGYITRLYRNKIDDFYNGKEIDVTDEELTNVKKLYNRELTLGNLFKDKIMNIETSNHIGVPIGKVIDVNNKKIKIKLYDTLNQGDGIRFGNDLGMIVNYLYDEKDRLINSSSNICLIDNKIGLKEKVEVRKTLDTKLIKEIDSYKRVRKTINITCNAYVGKPLSISVSDGINSFILEGNIIEQANNSPTTKERIKEQLSRLGDSPFTSNPIVNTDNKSFIPIKELNDLRRELIDKLIYARENNKKEVIEKDFSITDNKKSKDIKLNILVRNEKQLLEVLKYKDKVNDIYIDNYDLYTKYKNKNIYYVTDRVKEEHNFNNDNLLCTSLSSVYKYKSNNNIVSDSYLNVVNSYSVNYLNTIGVQRVTLSYEAYNRDIPINNTELIIYGVPTLMIIKTDIIDNYDRNSKYYLENIKGFKFPVVKHSNYTSIYHNGSVNRFDKLDYYKSLGIKNFRIELLNEEANAISKLIEDFYG